MLHKKKMWLKKEVLLTQLSKGVERLEPCSGRHEHEQPNYEHLDHYCHGYNKLKLSHIVIQISLCGRVGPWPMPHDHDPTLPCCLNSPTYDCPSSPLCLVKSKSQNGFWRYWFLKCLDGRGVYRYITHHNRAFYYVLLIWKQITYLRINYLQFFQYSRFLDTKSSLNMGTISWSNQTIRVVYSWFVRRQHLVIMIHVTVISDVAQLSLWPNSPKPPLSVIICQISKNGTYQKYK